MKKILSKENIGFGGLQYFYWSGFCAFFGFLVMYLKTKNFNEVQIGIIMSAISIASIVGQPFWGYFSDKRRGIKKILIASLLISSISGLFIPQFYSSIVAVSAICIIISFTENSMQSIIDSWSISSINKKPWIDYGLTRGMGSLGYAITAVILGVLLDRFDYNLIFYFHLVLQLGAVAFCFILEDIPTTPEHESEPLKLKVLLKSIKESRMFICFLVSTILVFTGFRAAFTFYPLLLSQKGGGNSELGMALFIMCICEIPILLISKRLLLKFKDTTLILISMSFFVLRIALHIVVSSALGLVWIQAMQGLSYALFLPASIYYINRISPKGLNSTYITIATAGYMGIGSILGSMLGGVIIERMGIYTLYQFSGIIAFLGFVVFILSIRAFKGSKMVEVDVSRIK